MGGVLPLKSGCSSFSQGVLSCAELKQSSSAVVLFFPLFPAWFSSHPFFNYCWCWEIEREHLMTMPSLPSFFFSLSSIKTPRDTSITKLQQRGLPFSVWLKVWGTHGPAWTRTNPSRLLSSGMWKHTSSCDGGGQQSRGTAFKEWKWPQGATAEVFVSFPCMFFSPSHPTKELSLLCFLF